MPLSTIFQLYRGGVNKEVKLHKTKAHLCLYHSPVYKLSSGIGTHNVSGDSH